MAFVKWLFIAIGGLVLVSLVGCDGLVGGTIGYIGTVEPIALSASDLAVGGGDQPGEREALIKGCRTQFNGSSKARQSGDYCECIADKADGGTSRFERLVLSSILNHNYSQIVRMGIGLANAGIEPDEIERVSEQAQERMTSALSQCAARLQ